MQYNNRAEAYDLRMFDDPNLVSVSFESSFTRRRKAKKQSNVLSFLGLALLIIIFLSVIIINNAQMVELGEEIRIANESLDELTTEYNLLEDKLLSTSNSLYVEEYAKYSLGLCKVSGYQVTYVELPSDDSIKVSEPVATDLSGLVSESFVGVLEYLNIR